MLDHVIIKQRDKSDCTVTRVMRGAECGTDHRMQRSIFRLSIRPPVRKRASTTNKLNTSLLNNNDFRQEFQLRFERLVRELDVEDARPLQASMLESWEGFSNKLYAASSEALGKKKKKH